MQCYIHRKYLYAAKFDDLVPGTLTGTTADPEVSTPGITIYDDTTKSNVHYETDATGPLASGSTKTTAKPVHEMKNGNPLDLPFGIGSPLFNGLAATGAAVIVLLLCVIIICIFVGCRRRLVCK